MIIKTNKRVRSAVLPDLNKGITLIFSFILLAILATLAITFIVIGYQSQKLAVYHDLLTKASFASDSGAEYAFAKLVADLANGSMYDATGAWIYFGEDVNKNGKMDAGEDVNNNGILDIQSHPITMSKTYSYEKIVKSGKSNIHASGEIVGGSGELSLIYKLKIIDENAKININGPKNSTITMLNTLGRVLFNEDDMGTEIFLHRPEDGYTTLENIIPIIGYEKYEKLIDYITTLSFRYKNALKSQGVGNRVGEIDKGGNIFLYFNQLYPKKWEFEARAPININVSPKEILIAQLTGLQGYYIDTLTEEEIQKYRNRFLTEQRDFIGTLLQQNGKEGNWFGEVLKYILEYNSKNNLSFAGGIFPAGGLRLSDSITYSQAGMIAERIIERRLRKSFNNFGGKFGVNDFVDSLSDILNSAQIDVLKANLNPNANLNFLNPDKFLYKSADKLSLVNSTSESCFLPGGYFTIDSVGEVLKGQEVLARVHSRRLVKLWGTLYFDTVSDFVAVNAAESYAQSDKTKEGTLGLSLNVYPVSPFATTEAFAIPDGRIGLNTLNNLYSYKVNPDNSSLTKPLIFHHQLFSHSYINNDFSHACKLKLSSNFLTDGIYTEGCSIYSIAGDDFARIISLDPKVRKLFEDLEVSDKSITGKVKSDKKGAKDTFKSFEITKTDILKILSVLKDSDIKTIQYSKKKKSKKEPYTREEIISSEIKKVLINLSSSSMNPAILWEVYFKPLLDNGIGGVSFSTKITENLVKNVLPRSVLDYIMDVICSGCQGLECTGTCAYLDDIVAKVREFYCTVSDYVRKSIEDMPVLAEKAGGQPYVKFSLANILDKLKIQFENSIQFGGFSISARKWYKFFDGLKFDPNLSGFNLAGAAMMSANLKKEVLQCLDTNTTVSYSLYGVATSSLQIFPHSLCFWDIIGGPKNCNLHFWVPNFSVKHVEKVFEGEDEKFLNIMRNVARQSLVCRGISGISYWLKPNWNIGDGNSSKGYTFISSPLFTSYIKPNKKGFDIVLYMLSGMGSEKFADMTADNVFGNKEGINYEIFENRKWQRISVVYEKEYKKVVAKDPNDLMAKWFNAIRGEVPSKTSLYFMHNNKIYSQGTNEGSIFLPVPSWSFSSYSNGFNIGSLSSLRKEISKNNRFIDPSFEGYLGVDGTIDEVVLYSPEYKLSDVQKIEDLILEEGRFNSKGGYFVLPTLCFPAHTKLLSIHSNSYFTEETKHFNAEAVIYKLDTTKRFRKNQNKELIAKVILNNIKNESGFLKIPRLIGGLISVGIGINPTQRTTSELSHPLLETPYIDDLTLYIFRGPLIFKNSIIRQH